MLQLKKTNNKTKTGLSLRNLILTQPECLNTMNKTGLNLREKQSMGQNNTK